jgi:hypothetical protein
MRTLRHCLLDVDPVLLRVIAARWSIDPTGLKPRDLIAQLERVIGDPARAGAMLDQLTPAERDALRAILSAGGLLPAPNFSQRFGAIRAIGPARLERDQPWRAPANPAEGLWYLGLIFKGFEQLPGGAMREVFIAPNELAPLLPLLKAAAPPIDLLPIAPTPDRVRAAGDAFSDDTCTLLSHLHNHFVRAGDRTLGATLVTQLRAADLDRFDFLRYTAERARLIKVVGRRLRPDPKPSTAWLNAHPLDQARQLFDAWRTADRSDLAQVRALQIERAVSIQSDPVAIRAVILAALRGAVPDAWHTLAALCERLKTQSPDFVRADFDTDYVREAASGEYLRGFAAWDRLEGALIRDLLARPLHWLGVIDLDDHASVFRLTATGAALLGLDSYEPSSAAASFFIARADATISVSAARRYDRFQLARVADPLALNGDEYLYRITPSSLERAASQKIDVPKVIDFLARAATQPLPLALSQAIQRWLKRGREVKVERAVIVRVKEAAILKRLQESPKTRGISIEVLGPTAARINEQDWPRLVKILAEAGVLVD